MASNFWKSISNNLNYKQIDLYRYSLQMIKGKKVKITLKGQLQGAIGTVRYVGPLDDKKGEGDYIGIQLDKPLGKNNGTLNGKQYFKAKDKYGAFVKPTYLVMPNGTSVATLLKGPSNTGGASKLSKQLVEMQKQQQQNDGIKKQLQQAQMKIKQLEETDAMKELEQSKKLIKQLEESNRVLKLENEKVKYSVKQQDTDMVKDLNEKIQFFKSQKEAIEKQKADLKKKNTQLASQLEEYAENLEMIQTLTLKNQTMESRNQKLKQDLQAANAELKNLKMMGQGTQVSNQELSENIKILNETVALLESDLNEEREANENMKAEIEKYQSSQGQTKKLQMKLKQKNEQIQQLTLQLQACSDAATYAQKLTLDNLKKDQQIKETTVKINQYLSKNEKLQSQLAMNKQFQDQLNIQLLNQEELLDKLEKQLSEKNLNINELTRQVEKYKKKLYQFTSQNSDLMLSSTISMTEQNKEEQLIPKEYMSMGLDQYQNKYYNSLKVLQSANQKLLKKQLQFAKIRNQVGVYMLNMNQALPEQFTSKFYPEVVQTLTGIKSANDKLYYIFETCSLTFKNKSEIYSKQNQQLAQWLILLMKQVSMLYSSLHKLQFSLITAQNQQQLSEILAHRVLNQQVRKIDTFSSQLLQRFSQDNISSSIEIQSFQDIIDTLDQINIDLKKSFTKQYETKMQLCYETMQTIIKTYQMIVNYKNTSQLGQNAEVDNLLENLIKSINQYLVECCMNPYLRYKASMNSYLEGVSLINSIFSEIKLEGNYKELGNLYSDSQNIKLLKETIVTTQFHVKQLLKDLEDIVYPSELAKIQTQLPGKVWQNKLKSIKEELIKAKETIDQKKQLENLLNQSKKKCLLLEREIKDKQSSKEIYEKRIGQLQLKVEQAITLENQNKRNLEKIKANEETNKLIEEEMFEQNKKRKMLEEQYKTLRQKYDNLQTEVMLRNKKPKNAGMAGLNTEDVASLTIFKNAIKQSNNLRTLETKKKMMQLKLSPIYKLNQSKVQENEEEEKGRSLCSVRRQMLDKLSKLQIPEPGKTKDKQAITIINIDKILQELNSFSQQKQKNKEKNQPNKATKATNIGKLTIPVGFINKTNMVISQGPYSYISH